MKSLIRTLFLLGLSSMLTVAIAADAPDPVVGTWKFNAAKSTGNRLVPKSETRTYVADGDGVALTWERVAADGKTSTVKATFHYDGKEYPVTGSPDFDTISAKRIDAHTIETKEKHAGKDVGSTRRAISADGKTLTLHQRRITTTGQEVSSLLVYDRQ